MVIQSIELIQRAFIDKCADSDEEFASFMDQAAPNFIELIIEAFMVEYPMSYICYVSFWEWLKDDYGFTLGMKTA